MVDWAVIETVGLTWAGAYAFKHFCTYLGMRLTARTIANRRL